ncbi:MAG: DUF433 domain-containing protein [Cyanobacteria bacterium J06621_11]
MNIQQFLIEKQIIHSDSEIMSGTPVFCGTRVPLQTFFDYLEGEDGLAEFLKDFPHLQKPVFQILEVTLRTVLDQEMTVSAHSA